MLLIWEALLLRLEPGLDPHLPARLFRRRRLLRGTLRTVLVISTACTETVESNEFLFWDSTENLQNTQRKQLFENT